MTASTHNINVIGIGSAHGADRLGWLLCERLGRFSWPPGYTFMTCRSPVHLPALLSRAGEAVVIDAAISTVDSDDRILYIDAEMIVRQRHRLPESSHGLGLTEALALAHALGQWPSRVVICAVAVNDQNQDIEPLSESVVPELRRFLLNGRHVALPS